VFVQDCVHDRGVPKSWRLLSDKGTVVQQERDRVCIAGLRRLMQSGRSHSRLQRKHIRAGAEQYLDRLRLTETRYNHQGCQPVLIRAIELNSRVDLIDDGGKITSPDEIYEGHIRLAGALKGDAQMEAYQREMVDEHVDFYRATLSPLSPLSGEEVRRRCIAIIGAAEALSQGVTHECVSKSDAVVELTSLITTWLGKASI
jgi:hypothetical protein